MPSRSLVYNNLYEEIILYLKEENIDFELIKEKEEEFIKTIKKEIIDTINKIKNKDKIDEDIRDYRFYDKIKKQFIGFNSKIIPGEIVREELNEIAKNDIFS